jgi:hypothetical protein
LIKQSLAQPAPPSTTRVERGRQLWEEHGDEIRFEHGVWLVPSQHDLTSVYEVVLGRRGESCECADFEYRGESGSACKHIVAATTARAKSTLCDCCGNRVPWRFVSEVREEDELLSWFAGDRLCADCVNGGYWA